MEKDLFRDLISDQDEPFPIRSLDRPAEVSETDSYMPGARMTAWARLHVHHRKKIDAETPPMPETPDLLITSDPFALEQLLAQADEADIVCKVSGIPVGSVADISGNVLFDEQLFEKLRQLTAGPVPSTGLDTFISDADNRSGDTGRLTIYRVRGDAVTSFLSGSENRPETSGMIQGEEEKQYTLVGGIIKMEPRKTGSR